jgi:(1->4)-alpha-D-glucan 1-alpha-D-glucosylmutase
MRAMVEWAGGHGAAIVGVSPLHALFPHDPAHRSPYSPSSRRFFNVLHIAIESIPELNECAEARDVIADPAFQGRLSALRDAELIDYPGVAALKYSVLEILYRHFCRNHQDKASAYADEFHAFLQQAGEDLERFALYQALQAHFREQDTGLWGWPVWPEAFRHQDSPEVRAFAEAHRERVGWFLWLQWHAERQIAAAGRRSFELGLGIGLYFDLAVGVDKGGAETWTHPDLYALDARIGCPPDDFGPLGQDWGLPPWIPARLRAAAYAPFSALLRANMRHAGALRIDHVMSLMRLYWIPPGMHGNEGAYVAYPLRDLLGVLALESQRNRCAVVGEDLGTVPGEVRGALHDLGVLSYRLFYFERDGDGDFLPPESFPAQALVAAATHDLPPLSGFWLGRDIDTRAALNLYPDMARQQAQSTARDSDRRRLLAMLSREDLCPDEISIDPTPTPANTPPALIRAIYRHLARTPCQIALVQVEDMLGVTVQANVPGTIDEHPNWRRRLPLRIEAWPDSAEVGAFVSAMRAERPGH